MTTLDVDDVAQIILAGFMGTGKTEVGRRLARRLGRPFVDVDRLVEIHAGRPIREIFAVEGEERFRALEREAVREAVTVADAVVATGGGALTDSESRHRLLAAGMVVCLEADPETICERVGEDAERPLLASSSREERLAKIRSLLAERAAAYAAAGHRVDTTDLTVDQVVDRLAALVDDAS